MRRQVTMAALFLDDNKTNDDGDGKKNGKNDMSVLTNNNFTRASRYFVHFFAVTALKLPNFTSPLNGVHVGEKLSISFFFFLR